MDLTRTAEYTLHLRHRHSDGEWSDLEARPDHDPSAHDPEREWGSGTLYVCKSCDEQVFVQPESDPSDAGE